MLFIGHATPSRLVRDLEGQWHEDSVNPIPTKQRSATDLYYGSRLYYQAQKNEFLLDGSLVHLLVGVYEIYSPRIEQSLIGHFERTIVQSIIMYYVFSLFHMLRYF